MPKYSLYDNKIFKQKPKNILEYNLNQYQHLVKDLDFRNTILVALNISIHNSENLEYDYESKKTFKNTSMTEFIECIINEILQDKINKDKITEILNDEKFSNIDDILKTRIEDALKAHEGNLDNVEQTSQTKRGEDGNLHKNKNRYIKLFNKPGGISARGVIVVKKITQDDLNTMKNETTKLAKHSSLKESKFLNLWMIKYIQINAEKKNTLIGSILQNQDDVYKNRLVLDRKIKLKDMVNNRVSKSDNNAKEFLVTKFIPNIIQIDSKKFYDEFNNTNNIIDKNSLVKTFATFYLLNNKDFGLFIGGNDIFLQKNGNHLRFFGIDFGYKTIHKKKLKEFLNNEREITKNDLIRFIKDTVRIRSFFFLPKIYKNIINQINDINDDEFKEIIEEIRNKKDKVNLTKKLINDSLAQNLHSINNDTDEGTEHNTHSPCTLKLFKILKAASATTTLLATILTFAIFFDAKKSIFNDKLIDGLNIPKNGFAQNDLMIAIGTVLLLAFITTIILTIFLSKEKIPTCFRFDNRKQDECELLERN
jgi:hypothetical protein